MHVIRLRGPWQWERIAGDDRATAVVQLPVNLAEHLPASVPGVARVSRYFNRPTGLGEGSIVWLAIEMRPEPDCIKLNGVVLPGGEEVCRRATSAGLRPPHAEEDDRWLRIDVTRWLQRRNLIEIESAVRPGLACELTSVRIEIREADA